jgi:hypothetical protein
LENKETKTVEFLEKQGSRKVIFDGKYTASKGDVYLNGFTVLENVNYTVAGSVDAETVTANDITYYVFVDGKEVGSMDFVHHTTPTDESDKIDEVAGNTYGNPFSDVFVQNGQSVSIRVEANVNRAFTDVDTTQILIKPELLLIGSDKD